MEMRRNLLVSLAFLLILSGTGLSRSLQGEIQWKESEPPPGPIRLAIFQLDRSEPIFTSDLKPDVKKYRFSVNNLKQGLYLIMVHVGDLKNPILHWVNLQEHSNRDQVRIVLSRDILEKLNKQYRQYKFFMATIHRSPLHLDSGFQQHIQKPRVMPDESDGIPGQWRLVYLAQAFPQSTHLPALVQTTAWQWRWLPGQTLDWTLSGSYTHGLMDRWSAQSLIRWQPLQAHLIQFHMGYEQTWLSSQNSGMLHQGFMYLRETYRLNRRWELVMDAGARVWINDEGHPLLTYHLSGEFDVFSTHKDRFYLAGGVGRKSLIDLMTTHPARKFYWYQQWIALNKEWSRWLTSEAWAQAGFDLYVPPGTVQFHFRFRKASGFWSQNKTIYTGQVSLAYAISVGFVKFGTEYSIERSLNTVMIPGFYPRALHYLRPHLKIELPTGTSVQMDYTTFTYVHPENTNVHHRTLDMTLEQALPFPILFSEHTKLRVMFINLLDRPVDRSVLIHPTPYFWMNMPRSWVWSLEAEW